MSANERQIKKVRDDLSNLATIIEDLARQEPPKIDDILDKSISGNKIKGGVISNFASTGIKDDSTRLIVYVNNDGILTDFIDVETLVGDVNVEGNLTVGGEVVSDEIRVSKLIAEHIESPSLYKRDIPDKAISGNKIQGGMITNFSSTGIKDESTKKILTVKNDGIQVDFANIGALVGDVSVEGALLVGKEIVSKEVRVETLFAQHIRSPDLNKDKFNANEIPDRAISGNKIRGGVIAQFSSAGIKDESTKSILLVNDDGISVDVINVSKLTGNVNVEGSLHVGGEITAEKLHVNEITADIRQERSTPLEFVETETDKIYGKGLQWQSDQPTKYFVLRPSPDRLFSSEQLDLAKDKSYSINKNLVLSESELGPSVRSSHLTKVGVLKNLSVQGDFKVDDFLFWNSDVMRLGIGNEEPNGMLSLTSLESEFIIDPEGENIRIGSWTTDDIEFITDDTARIQITKTGHIHLGPKGQNLSNVTVNGKLGIGVNNVKDDVSLHTAGPIRFDNKKFEVGTGIPQAGHYSKGDIVWNSEPKPTGFIGWVCIREGNPGTWKPFGQIGA